MAEGFVGRTFQPGDEITLIDLYNQITGRLRTKEEFVWEWLETPEGQGSIWVIEDESTKQIVGHHGLIPVRLSYFGQPVLSGKTENTMVRAEYRGKIGYTSYERQFLEEAKSRYGLTYTTRGYGPPARVRLRLGYFAVGGYATYVHVGSRSALDKLVARIVSNFVKNAFVSRLVTLVQRPINLFLIRFFVANCRVDETVRLKSVDSIDEVAQDLDSWWDKNRSAFGVTVSRHARYLKWRLFDNPNTSYAFMAAMREKELVGYIVTERIEAEEAIIHDIIVENNDSILFDTVMQLAIRSLKQEGIHVLAFQTLRSDNELNRSMKRNGFRAFRFLTQWLFKLARRHESLLYVRILDPELDQAKAKDPRNWYFTSLFGEGLDRSGSLFNSFRR